MGVVYVRGIRGHGICTRGKRQLTAAKEGEMVM